MGFVGGGGSGNIAISTALPTPIYFSCTVLLNIHPTMGNQFKIFYACQRQKYMDIENPALPAVPAVCRVLCSNITVVTVVLWDSNIGQASCAGVARFWIWSPYLVVPGWCLRPMGWPHTYKMVMEHFVNPNLSVAVAKCCFLGFVVWDNFYVFGLYCNPVLDDWIYYCLLTSMAAVQANYVHVFFLFVSDLNGHHQEWLRSKTTNRHSVAAFDFATVSGGDQLVVGLTHARAWWCHWPPANWCSWPSKGCCCSTYR